MSSALKILSTMALEGLMRRLRPESGAVFAPTVKLVERVRAGERADLAILTADAIDTLVADGVLEGRTDLARSFVGVAVRSGAPHPDISTREAFVATLLAAPSVAMSQAGASGLFMAGLLERLGLTETMQAKTTILAAGYTASLAASGQVAIAIQQVSELMAVPGVDIVGRLPAELGGDTVFSAALFRDAASPEAARALVAALAAPGQATLYRACGLEQAGLDRTNSS